MASAVRTFGALLLLAALLWLPSCGGRTPLEPPPTKDAGAAADIGVATDVRSSDRPSFADLFVASDLPEGRPDTPSDVAPDAATPDGAFWTLELSEAPVTLSALSCAIPEGQSAVLVAKGVLQRECEHAGPLEVQPAMGPNLLQLMTWVWVQHGVPCHDFSGSFERELKIPGLTVGDWTVVPVSGGSPVTLRVSGPPPPVTCTSPGPAGAPCLVDCDCLDGRSCYVQAAMTACQSTCQVPCSEDLDCPAGHSCASAPLVETSFCVELAVPECTTSADCPGGMRCDVPANGAAASCNWDIMLNAAIRHPCADDSECDEGLECVRGDSGARTCEVRCTTQSMRCPPVHSCRGEAGDGLNWVCEWDGE